MSDSAVATLAGCLVTVVTMVVGFLTLWVKLKYGAERTEHLAEKTRVVESKIDNNTQLTMAGTAAAAHSAREAAAVAGSARQTAEKIDRKLNGGIDAAVREAIAPLREALDAHAALDERNQVEVQRMIASFVTNTKLQEFSEYVHQRNHDMLDALNAVTLKLDELMARMGLKGPRP